MSGTPSATCSHAPSPVDSILRMRKLLKIERGDWRALVLHVRETTRLKTGVLSARADVSPETWWRWEKRGQRPKEADVVERFARAFSIEPDDAMWAAGLLIEDESAFGTDPRLHGLNPEDEVVRHIMSLNIDEERRERMLNRQRQIVALRVRQDIEEIDLMLKENADQGDNPRRVA
jgi:hypothetical protein